MQITVYRDPIALRFIRCLAPIPGSKLQAGGAGWTLSDAMARCQSEVIERAFELQELRPSGIVPLGIAAHLTFPEAHRRSLHETIEALCLKQIHSEQRIRCIFRLRLGQMSVGLARTSSGYFALIRGLLDGVPIAAHSAAPSAFASLLKVWEEYRSIQFFKPRGRFLKNFTKANRLFSEEGLRNLSFCFEPRFVYRPNLSPLTVASAERSGRVIAYYFNEGD